jgi:hypothetical protein
MCEFCLDPSGRADRNSDANRHEFAGFFSADAINAAVAQAQAYRSTNKNNNADTTSDNENDQDEDDDGT